ncbi:transcriptional regulator [Sphingomonas sp. TDK1]|uniref:transcriptional regulator n=1 Tax=Sphingomonas sp. TDK1 TaxID=453247 RepID=UPI000A0466B2|nr:YdaS family helix-turn-helix protein [Sphingomonas sp. TDK1]
MDLSLTPSQSLERAVAIAGSQSALARVCGISQAAVWKWLANGKHLPAEHVLRVEKATGVPRSLLRPDIYPEDLHVRPALSSVVCDPGSLSNAYHFSDTPAGRTAAEAPAAAADRSPIPFPCKEVQG